MCPFNKSRIMWASAWITFFIKYSNRAKHKEKSYFSWSNQYFDDQGYSKKFCRKTAIDVPFEAGSWIEKNSQFEKKLWTLYCNPKTKNSIFDIANVNKIRKLFTGYSYVQSLQVIKVLPNLRTPITQQNLPYDIEKLQCIFIESFSTAILAVFELSKSLDVVFLKKNGKHSCCVKRHIFDKTTQFRLKLLQKCNLKAVEKSFIAKKICYVPFPQKTVEVRKFFGVSALVSKVLQSIII